ncbi:conserved hypothetical protein [Ricinus communis]|uniref:Uncharacterized protein n=1 Tax=Ricinus communis TaxID=3988 RepID=B9RK66_RICCO|nr:conserved hypothetical protein [Ricinus communis]|eukprot:XP_002514110.1 uncharacterized protein LOC8272547 [Ricinus communis]
MATLEEITDLFSKLAFHLQTLSHASSPKDSNSFIDLSISKLNQSLNIIDNTQTRVLDTALSLMCFRAPQVFDSTIEYLVKTIVSVLSSSIRCNVLRLEKEEVLQIGSAISKKSFLEFIQVVNDVVSKLEENGMPCHLLLCAFARVAVSASCYRYLVPTMHVLDTKSINGKSSALSKLLCSLPKDSLNNHEIPPRLLSWYLDPLALKHNISNILQVTMERPFLLSSKEFYDRMEWRSILMCLVLSPTMFIHTKALLHNWFMLTGLGSILELLIELVALILDVISRPTWWGMSMELGSKLPYANAYFPYKNHLLRILVGPLSSISFLQLVYRTTESVSHIMEQFGRTCKASVLKIASTESKSIWALAICFPDWFYFASVLLFSTNCFQKSHQSKRIFGVPKSGKTNNKEQSPPAAAAARYIAWILSPNNQSQQDWLFGGLTKISEFWTLRQIDLGTSGRDIASCRKKLKNSKCYNIEEDFSLGTEDNCQTIGLWLKEFQSIMKHGNESVNNLYSCEANSYVFAFENHMFFRRIPLGILIGFPSYVNEDGFELLLHYAATGRMLPLTTKNDRKDHLEKKSMGLEDLGLGSNSKKEAVAGACLVFSLSDTVERISASLFENEKSGLDAISQVKLRAGRYLIKCLKSLIQLNIAEDGHATQMDLHDRLERWRHQGQEMLNIDKDLDDAIKALSNELLPS